MKRRVLVVEDDDAVRMGVRDALEFEGFEPIEAADGAEGLTLAKTGNYDLLLLDLSLPHVEGLTILREMRKLHATLPVIILTARGTESDRIQGLRRGADDYVVKPFSVKELLARVHAVLRRSPERPSEVQLFPLPDGEVNLERCEVTFVDGTRQELSQREVELLRYLAGNAGRAVSREELLQSIWRVDPDRVQTRAVDMHVVRLREKLRDNEGTPKVLLTVRGKGYMAALPAAARGEV